MTDDAAGVTGSELGRHVVQVIAQKIALPVEALLPDAAFEDLDFDSLVLVELAVVLEERFGVAVTDHALAEAGTVAGTVELVRAGGGSAPAQVVDLRHPTRAPESSP